MKNKEYDGIVIFYTPIQIVDDGGDVISIYGLLYNKQEKHNEDLWRWKLNRYVCYLQGCERVQCNGGKLAPELVITSGGNMISLNVRLKNLIYRIMKKEIIRYRIIETVEPIVIQSNEVEDNLVISQQLLGRIQNSTMKI